MVNFLKCPLFHDVNRANGLKFNSNSIIIKKRCASDTLGGESLFLPLMCRGAFIAIPLNFHSDTVKFFRPAPAKPHSAVMISDALYSSCFQIISFVT